MHLQKPVTNIRRRKDDSSSEKWDIGFLVPPVLITILVIFLTLLQPPTSKWIWVPVEDAFMSNSVMSIEAPTQIGQPDTQMRSVNLK
jgi:hypothetical protein